MPEYNNPEADYSIIDDLIYKSTASAYSVEKQAVFSWLNPRQMLPLFCVAKSKSLKTYMAVDTLNDESTTTLNLTANEQWKCWFEKHIKSSHIRLFKPVLDGNLSETDSYQAIVAQLQSAITAVDGNNESKLMKEKINDVVRIMEQAIQNVVENYLSDIMRSATFNAQRHMICYQEIWHSWGCLIAFAETLSRFANENWKTVYKYFESISQRLNKSIPDIWTPNFIFNNTKQRVGKLLSDCYERNIVSLIGDRDSDRFILIHCIFDSSLHATAELLILAGVNVNACDNGGSSPLLLASGTRNVNLVKRLIDAGADVNASSIGTTPLISVCRNDSSANVEIVKLLIDAGAKIEATNHLGKTALSIATESGCPSIIRLLEDAMRAKSNCVSNKP